MKWYVFFIALFASAFQFSYWGLHSDSPLFISCSTVVYVSLLLTGFGMLLNRKSPIPPAAIIFPWFFYYLFFSIFCIDFSVKRKLIAWIISTLLFLFLLIPLVYYWIKKRKKS